MHKRCYILVSPFILIKRTRLETGTNAKTENIVDIQMRVIWGQVKHAGGWSCRNDALNEEAERMSHRRHGWWVGGPTKSERRTRDGPRGSLGLLIKDMPARPITLACQFGAVPGGGWKCEMLVWIICRIQNGLCREREREITPPSISVLEWGTN